MSDRAVTIRCRACGLEVTGVEDPTTGLVRPSDRSRPEPGAKVKDGYCIRDMPNGPRRP